MVNAATGRSLNFNEASVGLTCNRRVTHRFIAGVTARSERSLHAACANVIITDASLHLPVCRANTDPNRILSVLHFRSARKKREGIKYNTRRAYCHADKREDGRNGIVNPE